MDLQNDNDQLKMKLNLLIQKLELTEKKISQSENHLKEVIYDNKDLADREIVALNDEIHNLQFQLKKFQSENVSFKHSTIY